MIAENFHWEFVEYWNWLGDVIQEINNYWSPEIDPILIIDISYLIDSDNQCFVMKSEEWKAKLVFVMIYKFQWMRFIGLFLIIGYWLNSGNITGF